MENNQKKGKFALSRKHFIIGMIGLCLVALIAEIVLLAHGFKKKPKKTADNTPTPLTASKEPTTVSKDPTPTGESDYYSVWISKVTKEYKTGQNGQKNLIAAREYDENGRETKCFIYDEDTGELKETAVFRYDRSGLILVDYLIPSGENEILRETRCFHSLPYGSDFYLWMTRSATSVIENYGDKVETAEYDEDGNLTFLKTMCNPLSNQGWIGREEWEFDSRGTVKDVRVFDENGALNTTIELLFDDHYSGGLIDITEKSEHGEFNGPWGITYNEYDGSVASYTEEGNGIFTYKMENGLPTIYARYMGNMNAWPGVDEVLELNRVIPELERGVIYRPNGNFPEYHSHICTFSCFDKDSFDCVDYIIYQEDGSLYSDSSVQARPDGQPAYADWPQQKYYEYDDTGRLTRYKSGNYVDVLTELDDNWNLVKKTDLVYNVTYEYEWALFEIRIYRGSRRIDPKFGSYFPENVTQPTVES
ncbi:MAG: hypothetical protein J6P36_00250 [Lachnospiraceae bacterium]|nr:hypothetical protein [Lachnospiraceae bacterium]